MRIDRENTIAIIIDIQERLFPYISEKERLEQNMVVLSSALQILKIPIIVTEQYRKGLGPTIQSIQASFSKFFFMEKMSFSCCDDVEIMKIIKAYNPKNVLIAGIESHVCVLQTALDLLKNNFNAVIIEDCVSSRKLNDKNIAIKRLGFEGATISTYESVIFELMRFSGTDEFKNVSRLLK